MKILLSFALIFGFAVNSFSAPLVFKTTKEMAESGDMLTFEASKYKKIRVGILLANSPKIKSQYENNNVRLFSIEGEDSIFIGIIPINYEYPSGSLLIDSPTPKIKLTATRAGTYKIYIWAE